MRECGGEWRVHELQVLQWQLQLTHDRRSFVAFGVVSSLKCLVLNLRELTITSQWCHCSGVEEEEEEEEW